MLLSKTRQFILMLIQGVEEVIFHFMSAVWLNVLFIKMKLGHLYLLYMYIEVGNKMRFFDFYTILLSIIMTMRTRCSIKTETMNHAILMLTNHVVSFYTY